MKFEYDLLTDGLCGGLSLFRALEIAGKDGWEAFAVDKNLQGHTRIYLKRRLRPTGGIT
ncbi:hypothetical protein LCGC14_3135780 [marine sediment metagenome]|uniref:Uncharacterized protein n=1 Tax=marine sediment metagenome TaxID=412755 RepID=A0A0F8VYF2_9ZZZZ